MLVSSGLAAAKALWLRLPKRFDTGGASCTGQRRNARERAIFALFERLGENRRPAAIARKQKIAIALESCPQRLGKAAALA